MPTAIGAYVTTSLLKARLGVSDTDDDTLMGTICDQVNSFIEGPFGTNRVLAPVSSATYLFDIEEPTTRLWFPNGIRAVSALSVGDYTGDSRDAIPSDEFFLRPLAQDRPNGWPATWLHLTDRPTVKSYFPVGREIVSMTATTGWAAIPDEIADVAATTATRAWHARQNGQADIVGNDETGAPLVSRYVASFHWGILRAYRVVVPPG